MKLFAEGIGMAEKRGLLVLERGNWRPDQISVHQITQRGLINLFPGDSQAIEENWQEILGKNPKAFAGPTIRLIGRHRLRDKLVLEVIPSDYKEGCLLGFLGVAMVPVTSDGFIALQGPVASVAATVGAGIRVPGCTPPHTGIMAHVAKEMREEFAVDINAGSLSVLSLNEISPPVAKSHNALVVKVSLSQTSKELLDCWQKAEDKWEGELKFIGFNNGKVSLSDFGGHEAFNRQSLLILAMVVDELIGSDYVEQWSRLYGYW